VRFKLGGLNDFAGFVVAKGGRGKKKGGAPGPGGVTVLELGGWGGALLGGPWRRTPDNQDFKGPKPHSKTKNPKKVHDVG